MQLHELKPIHKSRKSKRIGRGGKRGTYSGHGMKGQKSRSGRRFQPIIRELIKRYPKLRGYRQKSKIKNRAPHQMLVRSEGEEENKVLFARQKLEIVVLNLEILEKKFEPGVKVNSETLLEKRLIRKILGRTPKVKILGKGEITKALNFENCQVSKQAKEKIEKAGGTVKF